MNGGLQHEQNRITKQRAIKLNFRVFVVIDTFYFNCWTVFYILIR